MDQRNRVLDGYAHWRHMANTVKRLCTAAMSGSATKGGNATYFQIILGNLVIGLCWRSNITGN